MIVRKIAGGMFALLPLLIACSKAPEASLSPKTSDTAAAQSAVSEPKAEILLPGPALPSGDAAVSVTSDVAATVAAQPLTGTARSEVQTAALVMAAPATPASAATVASAAVAPGDQAALDMALLAGFKGKKVRQGASVSKKIALTFDDGPRADSTPRVLAILKAAGVHATFFMLGKMVQAYPEIARQVADAGHEIGNHSFNHPNLNRRGSELIIEQIEQTNAAIKSATGRDVYLFRPPGGFVNATVQSVCRERGLAIIMWSIDPRDWQSSSSPQSVHASVMKHAHGGAIVCMHDIHERTIAALPGMLAELKAKGFEFTTVGRLLEEQARMPEPPPGSVIAAGAGGSDLAMGGAGAAPAQPIAIPLEDSALN